MVRETVPDVLEVCADGTMARETAPEVLEVHANGTMVRVPRRKCLGVRGPTKQAQPQT